MTFAQITYEVSDGVATVTLDREEQLNAFTLQMGGEILAAIDRADADDGVRVLVFTGRGRAFCAGADLSGGTEIFAREDPGEFRMERDADLGGVIARRLYDSLKPSIAAINGPAVGIGITMTLAMDVRLAATTARIGFPFTRIGLVPEACSAWFLPRIVGISQAAEWIYSARVFPAQEALAGGLLRSLHEPDELLRAAQELARSFAQTSSPVAVATARRMLWGMLSEPGPRAAHEIDSRGLHALGRSPDAQEGVQAFLDKRDPQFPMRVSADLPQFLQQWWDAGSVQGMADEHSD
ncbi:unannotated protein [freshwater metagenome]|uniref:Unannotated protein n=1 Tax=freshwater metagenome TaxID=449393 RepID=A0A6J7DEZ3_9ZZZZ|nr:enoyl-CoA hydratase [Actinomycetota bacterium]